MSIAAAVDATRLRRWITPAGRLPCVVSVYGGPRVQVRVLAAEHVFDIILFACNTEILLFCFFCFQLTLKCCVVFAVYILGCSLSATAGRTLWI